MQTPHRLHRERFTCLQLRLTLAATTLSHRASIECHSLPRPLPLRSLGGAFRGRKSVRCFGRAADRLSCVSRLFVEFGPPPNPHPLHPQVWAPPHPTRRGLQGLTEQSPVCAQGGLRQQAQEFFCFFFPGKTNTEVCPVFQSASRLPGDYSWAAGSKGHSAAELKFLLGSDWHSRPVSDSGVYCTATWRTPGKQTHCGFGQRLFGKQENKQEDPKTEIWTEIK